MMDGNLDEKFQFQCCWTCVHCVLDLRRGNICTATGRILATRSAGNEKLHEDRTGCNFYRKG